MLAKFRHRYPQGSLVSELIQIDRGTYIVKVSVQIDGIILATALAGADTVENAEDAARERAIATLFLDQPLASNNINSETVNSINDSEIIPQAKTEPLGRQKSSEEPKIVNFSKSQSELSAPDQSNLKTTENVAHNSTPISDKIENHSLEESSFSQSNLKSKRAENPVQSTVNSRDLFGDTFSAEIPEEVSLSDNNIMEPVAENNSIDTSISEMAAMDFNEIKQKTDIEIKRLNWTKDQGKEFLMTHYGKKSRLHLTDEQLLEFLRYLEKLPNPIR